MLHLLVEWTWCVVFGHKYIYHPELNEDGLVTTWAVCINCYKMERIHV